MAEGEGSFLSQVIYLFCLVYRLKSWKMILWILLIPAICFNFIIYKDIESAGDGEVSANGLTELKMGSALSHKNLIDKKDYEKALVAIASDRKGNAKDWVQSCGSLKQCKSTFLEALLAQKDSIYSMMNYAVPALYCLMGNKAPIICPFAYHMMGQSMDYEKSPESVYKEVTIAKFYDPSKEKEGSGFGGLNVSTPDSMCTRTLKTGKYIEKFFLGIMGHVMILASGFILNFTVGTLSSISNLKENGFLQLVFNNGLSVTAFWLVYITIAVVESLLFIIVFLVSYTTQCPGFYTADQLMSLFFSLFGFFMSIATLGLLFATLVGSFFIILLLMILVTVLFACVMLVTRLAILDTTKQDPDLVNTLLIFPPGHIVEMCFKYMIPKEVTILKPHKAYNTYFDMVEPILLITPFLLSFVTIYLDFIVKNGNGLCLPFLFLFNPNFWNPYRHKLIDMIDDQPKRANVEPAIGIPAVIATDIMMTYPSGPCGPKRPPVLKGVTCTVYQGQITALIGHNGAGKTTLIRVLMGEEIPTSGVAIINGHRVTDPYQRLALRGAVSICKQVDVLSNYLTVMESMKLTLVAKGYTVESQVNNVLDMMKRLGLAGKENVQAMDLSGGQMRKVCSILCLLGNPKLVILDEPTSGLDPVSRRNLWQILQDHKAGRSIILCTQFMDEADILADRKMFLSAGKLICAGSSLFLKYAFGCCVSINVSLRNERYTMQLLQLLKKVKLVSQSQTELVLQIPAEKSKALAEALLVMEQHPELVDAFGVSQAQLDDIFMRLKYIDMDNIEAAFSSKKLRKVGRTEAATVMMDRVDFNALYNFENRKPITSNFCTQFKALMSMNMKRQWKAKLKFLFRILVPVFLVAAVAGLGSKVQSDLDKNANAKPKKADSMQPDASESTKSVVLEKFNQTKYERFFMPRVFCVYDGEELDAAETEKLLTAQFREKGPLTKCKEIFNDFPTVHWVAKKKEKSLKEFVQGSFKQALRDRCPKSTQGLQFSCFVVYADSWEMTTPNKERSLYMVFYENPPESPMAVVKQHIIFQSIKYYDILDIYFNGEKIFNRDLATRSFLALTFNDMQFMDCYELMAYAAAFALIPVTYMNDPIEDKDSGVRQHLASMGMSTIAYWFNTFVQHWMHNCICFLCLSLACLSMERYRCGFFFINLFLPTLLFGTTTSQLSVYVISAMMKKTNAIVLVMYFFFAMFLSTVVIYIQDKDTILMTLVCLLPPITPVAYVIIGMKVLVYSMLFFDVKDVADVPDLTTLSFSNGILSTCISVMPIHVLVLIALIYIIENPGALQNLCAKKVAPSGPGPKPAKDEGVKIEADRLTKLVRDTRNMLEVRELQKVYPNGVHAVRGTTFGTLAGEIIGLLGPNGAGKTTSMSIIVGEEAASSGTSEVHFSGTWMSGIDGAKCGAIGYCPQHNPLFNQISVYDHLVFYADIRGIPTELSKAQIVGLIDGLGLKPHSEKAAEQLSGGNKRRLCLAIALLGNPSLVVIDEASTGVDPENKRFIWCAIRGMASKERSVMITTHSMEEVEALCSRVGIMNKGVMIGFGTVQQLRSRHGEAYTLDVLMKAKLTKNLDLKKKKLAKRIAKHFPDATVMEDLMRCMQFNLPRSSVPSFSSAMRWLISKKRPLGIQYFSMYQMSLDQVFVKLVKEYDEQK